MCLATHNLHLERIKNKELPCLGEIWARAVGFFSAVKCFAETG